MGVPDAAEHFQRTGLTALIYDPRSTGLSDGQPRNEIDPVKQVEDMSDAATFLSGLPTVDPYKIGFWGMSFGAAVSLCAASLDRRAKFVIAVCPLTDFEYSLEKRPQILAKCIKDRVSQAKGNAPFYLPMVTEKGENPAGFGQVNDRERNAKLVKAGKELAPNHVNRTTLQSYSKIFMWQPISLWRHLSPTPAMFIIPESDTLSPAEAQLHHFGNLSHPKRLHVEPGVGHEEILVGEHLPSLMNLQTGFIHDAILGNI